MTPRIDRDGVTLYHGDARAVLRQLELARPLVCITDPVWPNGGRAFPGIDAWALFAEVLQELAPRVDRLIVVLGCDSDPRFLTGVPAALPFVRVAKLRYAAPSYKHPLLIDFECAYVFGARWENGNGTHRLLPGECRPGRPAGRSAPRQSGPMTDRTTHPCPRNPAHMRWLVENFTRPGDLVLDPFAGRGTTLEAARDLGRRAVGVEIEARWCDEADRRLAQRVMFAPEAT